MGKSLIIKGADFSENGIAPVQPYFPYDIENEIIHDDEVVTNSLSEYGRYSVSQALYSEYLDGKKVVGIKVKVGREGTLSLYKQDPVNQTAELYETLVFDETGWQTKLLSKPIVFENGIYLSVMKRNTDTGEQDTGRFCFQNGAGITANVTNAKFAKGSGEITTGDLGSIDAIFGFCFLCID